MSGDDVLAVADHRRGALRPASYELVTAARDLADAWGGDLHVAVVGGDVDAFADKLDLPGVDAVRPVPVGAEFNHDVSAAATTALAASLDPGAVLIPSSVNGMDYAPAVASRLSVPLVTDVTGIDADEALTVVREMYGSKVETTLSLPRPAVLTLRAGEWAAAEGTGDAAVDPFDLDVDDAAVRSTVRGFEEAGDGEIDLDDAEFIVAVGRGIEEEENVELAEELADALDATLAASRPVVDNGWLPKNRQVGQSGTTVSPTVYLALGISGAVQHVAGIKGAETIIAVNTDPDAPIFDVADYGVVDDLFEVAPELVERFG
jgi:electron transfer flavoprotein alpha subunit